MRIRLGLNKNAGTSLAGARQTARGVLPPIDGWSGCAHCGGRGWGGRRRMCRRACGRGWFLVVEGDEGQDECPDERGWWQENQRQDAQPRAEPAGLGLRPERGGLLFRPSSEVGLSTGFRARPRGFPFGRRGLVLGSPGVLRDRRLTVSAGPPAVSGCCRPPEDARSSHGHVPPSETRVEYASGLHRGTPPEAEIRHMCEAWQSAEDQAPHQTSRRGPVSSRVVTRAGESP